MNKETLPVLSASAIQNSSVHADDSIPHHILDFFHTAVLEGGDMDLIRLRIPLVGYCLFLLYFRLTRSLGR